MSVMRVAAPPVAGSVQMLPCRSIASVRPSGATATDIDVPSCTVTSMCAGAGTGAPLSEITRPSTTIAASLRRITASPGNGLARILVRGCELQRGFFTKSSNVIATCNYLDNLLAVETAVLDEDGAGVDAGNRAAGHEQT